jgi:hypothetical protein
MMALPEVVGGSEEDQVEVELKTERTWRRAA